MNLDDSINYLLLLRSVAKGREAKVKISGWHITLVTVDSSICIHTWLILTALKYQEKSSGKKHTQVSLVKVNHVLCFNMLCRMIISPTDYQIQCSAFFWFWNFDSNEVLDWMNSDSDSSESFLTIKILLVWSFSSPTQIPGYTIYLWITMNN